MNKIHHWNIWLGLILLKGISHWVYQRYHLLVTWVNSETQILKKNNDIAYKFVMYFFVECGFEQELF